MNKETKRTVLIISLTAVALLIAIMPFLSFGDHIIDCLRTINFFHWTWFVVFCLAGYALKEVWAWKIASGRLYPKVIAIFFLLMALLLAALWFCIMFVFEWPT